jgi:hypothetical protein
MRSLGFNSALVHVRMMHGCRRTVERVCQWVSPVFRCNNDSITIPYALVSVAFVVRQPSPGSTFSDLLS